MSMTDPVADLLTRVRNANSNGYKTVKVPYSHLKKNILKGEKVIRTLKRVSTPGRRIYKPAVELPSVLGGLGIAVVSTSRGVLSNVEARKLGIGGEILCEVW
jgi:small subunit ribosomal protein S8